MICRECGANEFMTIFGKMVGATFVEGGMEDG